MVFVFVILFLLSEWILCAPCILHTKVILFMMVIRVHQPYVVWHFINLSSERVETCCCCGIFCFFFLFGSVEMLLHLLIVIVRLKCVLNSMELIAIGFYALVQTINEKSFTQIQSSIWTNEPNLIKRMFDTQIDYIWPSLQSLSKSFNVKMCLLLLRGAQQFGHFQNSAHKHCILNHQYTNKCQLNRTGYPIWNSNCKVVILRVTFFIGFCLLDIRN